METLDENFTKVLEAPSPSTKGSPHHCNKRANENWIRIVTKGFAIIRYRQHRKTRGSIIERAALTDEFFNLSAPSVRFENECNVAISKAERLATRLWRLTDDPDLSNTGDLIYSFVMNILSIAYVANLVVRTDPQLYGKPIWDRIEMWICFFFFIEFTIRSFSSNNPQKFIFEILSIVEAVSLIPTICFIMNWGDDRTSFIDVCRIIGSLRSFRIIKTLQATNNVQVLKRVLARSFLPLLMVTLVVLMVIWLLGTAVYFTDFMTLQQKSNSRLEKERFLGFASILDGIYWATTTVCTIGYGDYVPSSPLGKFVGFFCAWLGIFVLSVPISIVSDNFLVESKRFDGESDPSPLSQASVIAKLRRIGAQFLKRNLQASRNSSRRTSVNIDNDDISPESVELRITNFLNESFVRREKEIVEVIETESQLMFSDFFRLLHSQMKTMSDEDHDREHTNVPRNLPSTASPRH